jgi:hypothetical protein
MEYGPQPAFVAEAFPAEVRYSGSSLGYQLSSITAGGPAPLIATWLFHEYGTTMAVSIYLALLASIAVVSAMFLPDRYRANYNSSGPANEVKQAKSSPAIASYPSPAE